jgi:hypothetical protein
MGCLVDDLLAFSRITKQGMIKGQVDPAALVREAWDLLAGGQPERLLNMTVGDLPTCQGDCALLKQVFVNLLSNALKFTRQRDPAVIEVGSIRRDGEIVYSASCSMSSSGCTGLRSMKARGLGWPLSSGSSIATADACGRKRSRTRARRSFSRWKKKYHEHKQYRILAG